MVPFGPAKTSPGIKWIMIITAALFLIELLPWTRALILDFGALIPIDTFINLQVWRLFSYMFLHSPDSYFHIIFNLLVLWMFGVEIEELWGTKKFVLFYLLTGAASGLFSFIYLFNDTMQYNSIIGASGAVLAVMTVYAFYFPHREVLLFFILPVNIRWIVIGSAFIAVIGSFQPRSMIAHLTHLGGIVVAFLYMKFHSGISGYFHHATREHEIKKQEKIKRQEMSKKEYFEKVIDPILDKIGQNGIESLSEDELALLKKVSKNNPNQLKKRKILPLDLFR